MKVLSQVNMFTFEEIEIPDELMEELYQEWYQRSLNEMDFESTKFDAIQMLESKKNPSLNVSKVLGFLNAPGSTFIFENSGWAVAVIKMYANHTY
jgi:hypothetical protein